MSETPKRKMESDAPSEVVENPVKRPKTEPAKQSDDGNAKSSTAVTPKTVQIQRPTSITISNELNVKDSIAVLERGGKSANILNIKYKICGVKPLLDAIIQHCGQKIVGITIAYGYSTEISKSTEYKDGVKHLREFLQKCGAIFPELRSMKISFARECDDIKHWDDVAQQFPKLTSLMLTNCKKFPIEKFIGQNPQLERLTIKNSPEWRMSQELLGSIDKSLPQLKHLSISFQNSKNAVRSTGKNWFKELKTLEIGTHNNTYSSALDFVNLSGKNLESLNIGACGDFDKKALPMIANYRNLKELEISACATNQQVGEIVKQLPGIEKLSICHGKISQMGILKVLKEAKSLKTFTIYPGGKIYDEDVERLCEPVKKKTNSAEWKVGDDGGGTIIIEKLTTNQ